MVPQYPKQERILVVADSDEVADIIAARFEQCDIEKTTCLSDVPSILIADRFDAIAVDHMFLRELRESLSRTTPKLLLSDVRVVVVTAAKAAPPNEWIPFGASNPETMN